MYTKGVLSSTVLPNTSYLDLFYSHCLTSHSSMPIINTAVRIDRSMVPLHVSIKPAGYLIVYDVIQLWHGDDMRSVLA